MKHIITILLLLSAAFQGRIAAQVAVPIDNYSVNFYGQVQLSIEAESGKYYILEAEHSSSFTWPSSIAMGMNGTMIISEPSPSLTPVMFEV